MKAGSLPHNLIRVLLTLALLSSSSACASGGRPEGEEARGLVIVNAPASGEVRRVLAREGQSVSAGAPLVEIAVRQEPQAGPRKPAEDPVARAARTIQASEAEIEAARAEVVRAEVEVQRLTPLVASGQASQGELDGARALYDRAQQRLQRAQSAAQGAQAGMVAARQQAQNARHSTQTPAEQLVAARASSAGTVSVLSVRPGERVTAGQPLVTLRAGRE